MNYFTADGKGAPLVLLHGGLSDSSAWMLQFPALTTCFRWYAFDRRGHGQTRDTDEPFHYEDMALETISFIERAVGEPAHLVGWSDGGIVALLVSMRRPDLVRRQVLIGANFHHDGLLPGFDTGDDPEAPDLLMIRSMYNAIALDPARWPVFYEKSMAMWRSEPTMTVDDLRGVTVPTLVLVGDDDCIHHSHTVELFENIPEAQLAVVPGTSHMLQIEKPALVNQLIIEFLDTDEPPDTLFPMRRAHLD
ncbi:MAG: hypothetical protein QOD92_637 [Acidimicrobiaceae bacterium]